MKKRSNKKRAKYKKATRSGSGSHEVKQAETKLKKYDFLSWLAPCLRLKKNTVSNLPITNVAEINLNDDGMTEAEDNFRDCPKRAYFLVFRPTNHLKLRRKDIAKQKNEKKRSNKLQKNQARGKR